MTNTPIEPEKQLEKVNQEVQSQAIMCDAETQMSRIMDRPPSPPPKIKEKLPEDGLFKQSF